MDESLSELTDEQQAAVLDLLERLELLRQQGQAVNVAELCRDHPGLAGEVDKALRFIDQASQFAQEEARDTILQRDEAWPDLGPRYRIEAQLGRGGMGVVYRAHDMKLERMVAIKVVRPDCLTAAQRGRLQTEAWAVAQLDHPHIIKVYDVGECQSPDGQPGAPYVSLEYVPGGNLAERLQAEERWDVTEACRLVSLLAGAMHHAHQRNIVHRDLKPENVLLAPPADVPALATELGCPKITDFGLSRQVRTEQRQTNSGTILGTPAYMAPEQAEGRPDVGPAADVYALGGILYRLLTGQLPFESASTVELLHKVCYEPPRPLREVNPGIPIELEALCLECLSKRPDQRPTAGQLAERLKAIETNLPMVVVGAPPSAPPISPPRPPISPPRPWFSFTLEVGGWLKLAIVLGVAVGLGALAWLGLSVFGLLSAPWGGTAEAKPLTGELVVRVWSPKRKVRGLRIGIDDQAVPICEDEQVQVEATLNEPAYAYVLWIDGKGAVTPLYPWNDLELKVTDVDIAPPTVKTDKLLNPSRASKGWPVDNTAGLDTVLLLARRTPWPANRKLSDLLGKVPAAPLRDRGEVVVRSWQGGEAAPDAEDLDLRRGPKGEAKEIDDMLLQLVDRLSGEFEVIRAVRFAHVPKGE
jgi:serine/threonine protein kinase